MTGVQTCALPISQDGIDIIIPAPECKLSVEEIAKKDVPAGVPYKIIETADVPSDRTFREAWEADFTNPDGHGIGADAWFAEQESKVQEVTE